MISKNNQPSHKKPKHTKKQNKRETKAHQPSLGIHGTDTKNEPKKQHQKRKRKKKKIKPNNKQKQSTIQQETKTHTKNKTKNRTKQTRNKARRPPLARTRQGPRVRERRASSQPYPEISVKWP